MKPYANCRMYGPYKRKDGRYHVCLVFESGRRQTVSYPKFLVEQAIGRVLYETEEVHHINRDFSDNRLVNLEIISKCEHAKLHVLRLIGEDFMCPVCKSEFRLEGLSYSRLIQERKRNPNRTGPYCSKPCAGKHSEIQSPINPQYMSLVLETEQVDGANSVKALIDANAELSINASVETLHAAPIKNGEDKVQTTTGKPM